MTAYGMYYRLTGHKPATGGKLYRLHRPVPVHFSHFRRARFIFANSPSR